MSTKPDTENSTSDVLLVIGDASETVDTLYPYFRLQEAGFRPYVIAPEKRLHQMVLHEVRPGWTITKEWEGYQIMADAAFADIDPENYQGIFSPIEFCGDNAAMIAMVGLEKFKLKQFDSLDFPAKPRWPLDEKAKFLKGAGVQL